MSIMSVSTRAALRVTKFELHGRIRRAVGRKEVPGSCRQRHDQQRDRDHRMREPDPDPGPDPVERGGRLAAWAETSARS